MGATNKSTERLTGEPGMTDGQSVDKIEGTTFPPPPRRFKLTVTEVTSVLIVTHRATKSVTGSLEDAAAHYRKVLIHNLLAGWWGLPLGPILTVIELLQNRRAMARLREIAATGVAPAAWLPDPSGRHVHRYWDGQVWTDHVADVSTDPVAT